MPVEPRDLSSRPMLKAARCWRLGRPYTLHQGTGAAARVTCSSEGRTRGVNPRSRGHPLGGVGGCQSEGGCALQSGHHGPRCRRARWPMTFRGQRHACLVREPDAGDLHVRFDERGVETELRHGYSGTAERKGRQQTYRTYGHRATPRLSRTARSVASPKAAILRGNCERRRNAGRRASDRLESRAYRRSDERDCRP